MTDTSAITDTNPVDATNGNDRPEKFDLASWIAGFQPTRKSCVLYGRTDLLATIDRLDAEASLPGLDGEEKRRILNEANATLDELKASGVEFVVQTLSIHAQKRLVDELREQYGADGETITHEMECAFIAAHIVEPTGVTADDIAHLYDASPAQVEKLSKTIRAVDISEPTITAPFSSKS